MTEGSLRGDRRVALPAGLPGVALVVPRGGTLPAGALLPLRPGLPPGPGLDPARRRRHPDPAGRAVQALRDYVASGFDNPHKLRTDPALEPLRKRDDFQKLVRDLEARVQGRKDTPLNR